MRLLLINSNRFNQPWPVIPFGLCCVAAAVEAAGHTVRVLDLCPSKDTAADIRKAVHAFNPDVTGISIRNIDDCSGYDTNFLLDAVKSDVTDHVKMHFNGPVIIGGPAVGINPEEILAFLDLPYAMQGEGERGMIEFLEFLNGEHSAEQVSGLVRRTAGGDVCVNPVRPVSVLDSLPFARPYRYLDLDYYIKLGSPVQVQSKRGCPLSCSYCTYNRIEGKEWRLRNPECVADEIQDMVNTTGIRHIEFTDSTFNLPLAHAKSVLRVLHRRGLDLRLRTMGLNPGAMDEELVDLMVTTGFKDVDVGVESGNNQMLDALGKTFRKDAIYRVADLLHSRNIPVNWFLLLGAPGETAETLEETLNTIDSAASQWDLICMGIGLRVYKGAPVAADLLAEHPECTNDNFLTPFAFQNTHIHLDDIKRIVKVRSLRRTNYCTFDEDEEISRPVLKSLAFLSKHIFRDQPVWKILIGVRKLEQILGIRYIRAVLYNLRNRSHLKKSYKNTAPFSSSVPSVQPHKQNVRRTAV